MGKKSVKENKNIYQEMREECNLTRERAGEIMEFVSADRIEKIENERSMARPEEVLAMSECYNSPELCNYYCTHECSIGKKYMVEVKVDRLSQIVLETLDSLEKLNKERNRLVEITVDGRITEDEKKDFERIQGNLEKLSATVDALRFWTEKVTNQERE
ncbi:MAG: helix-turn-helix transcriptional regulator [Lachnospiraceae bacterium]|nr:helix-turn-helix transcriptional regulator [Lachnospiraceae bacterium]